MGQAPSRSVEAGQPLSPRSSSLNKQAFCVYDSPLPNASTPDEQLAWTIEFLKGVRDRLASIDREVDVRLGFSSTSGQGSLALTAEELSLLGDLGVQLNIDLYSAEESDEDED
jgi:hypothetical protein